MSHDAVSVHQFASTTCVPGLSLTAILDNAVGETLADFIPAPPAADRFAWDGLPAGLAERLVDEAKAAQKQEWPRLTAKLYGAFRARGDRKDYETLYFIRRRMLNALALGSLGKPGALP